MKEKILSLIIFSSYSYVVIFFLLMFSGVGLPVPEELLVIFSGYLYKKGIVLIYPILIFLYFGILIGDIIPYLLGMSFGYRVFEFSFVKRYFTARRIRKLDALLRLYGSNSIIIIRLLFIGIRPLSYAFLGTRKYKIFPQEFLGVAINLFLWFFVGVFLSEHIEFILSIVYRVKEFIILGVILFFIFYFFERVVLNKKLKFFKRIGISFTISGIILLLVFAFETVKFKKYDFLKNESKISNTGVGFFISSPKKDVLKYFKKKGWKYRKVNSHYIFDKDNSEFRIFKTGLYLKNKPVWRFVGDISIIGNVEVEKIKRKDKSEIVVFIIDRNFFN